MKYDSRDDGLYYATNDDFRRISDPIRVISRTRSSDRNHSYGVVVEWENIDGVSLREIFPLRVLNGTQSPSIREELIDRGFWIEPTRDSWGQLQRFLLSESRKAPPAVIVSRTGWHGDAFVTRNWIAGAMAEPIYYDSQQHLGCAVSTHGSLRDWHVHIGKYCVGNPYLVFSVGVALLAPLLKVAGLENGGFHLVGGSSQGKTLCAQIAASVYGGPDYLKGWSSTANGLAAVASAHHDKVLILDEVSTAHAEDIDLALYQITNGLPKNRADKTGKLAAQETWRVVVLSTGEEWISEILAKAGRPIKAGQQARFVEIPVVGQHGVFEELHGFSSPQALADYLKLHVNRFYGTPFKEWVGLLASNMEDIQQIWLPRELEKISNRWSTRDMSSQVHRVARRFVLVGAALALACENGLLPWSATESKRAVDHIFQIWVGARGHTRNHEEYSLLTRLEKALPRWEEQAIPLHDLRTHRSSVFWKDIRDDRHLLIARDRFLNEMSLPRQYMRELPILTGLGIVVSNETTRGTYKVQQGGTSHRFFAVSTKAVREQIEKLKSAER